MGMGMGHVLTVLYISLYMGILLHTHTPLVFDLYTISIYIDIYTLFI